MSCRSIGLAVGNSGIHTLGYPGLKLVHKSEREESLSTIGRLANAVVCP